MNSKKLSRKLDRAIDKIRKYQTMSVAVDALKDQDEGLTLKEITKAVATPDWNKTCVSVSFSRDETDDKCGYGTLGKWKIVVGKGNDSKEFLGKSLNSALRYCLRHYKDEYLKNIASSVA